MKGFLWFLLLLLCAAGIWLFVPASVPPAIIGFFSSRTVQVVLFVIAFITVLVLLMGKEGAWLLFMLVTMTLAVVLHPWTRFIALGACAAAGLLLWLGNPWGFTLLMVSLVWLVLSLWANLKPGRFR